MQNTTEQQFQKKLEELETLNRQLTEERNLLRALVDNYPDSIYVKDVAARKILANKANVKNMGFETEADVLGKSDLDLFPPEIAAKLFADDQLVLKQGQSLLNHEEKLINSNGRVYWMLTTKIPWRDNAGNIIGIIGGGRNITQQKEVEIKLKEERNLLRTLIDNLPDCIYAKDSDARKIMANPADLKNLGCKTEAEAIGKNDFDLFPKDVAETFFADDQSVLKDGKSVINREEKAVLQNGETRWLLTSKIPWRDAGGKIIGLVGIGRDITDRKKLEEQIVTARRMESIGRLATGVAHDLNNILAPILISIELLRSKLHDEEYLKMLANAEANAHRGADIIKQMLWFSRGLAGQRLPLDIQHLMGNIAQFAPETFDKSIHVEKQIAPDLWRAVGDSAQLHQVLLNLCTNARDAMPDGGTLTIAASNVETDGKNYVVLKIADTGAGIPPEILDKIFEPFFTTKQLGHGLGLSTTQSIVKSHGGFIKAESQPGQGASFRVYLPAHV